jgi:flagellar biosynthetic protein FlhB
MAEELGERTELPTGRKLGEARSRGQVARSPDLSGAIDLGGAVLLLLVFGSGLVSGLAAVMRKLLEEGGGSEGLNIDSVAPTVLWAGIQSARILAPLLLAVMVISYVAQFIQVGWLFTTAPLIPKFDRLNPVNGLQRLFGKRNLVKTLVNAVKLAIVSAVALAIIRRDMDRIVAMPMLEAAASAALTGKMMLELTIWLAILLILIGFVDWFYQRWQHTQDLKMTRQEVKDERRSSDGDPDVKSRRLRMARDIALQKIKQAVPKADVIVTNPTHFSVALRYDQGVMRAPKLVAKGADFMAFRIREVAIASGVPIVERPPLARALFYGVEEGQEIPPEHYQAVAEILAYVYRLEGKAA